LGYRAYRVSGHGFRGTHIGYIVAPPDLWD